MREEYNLTNKIKTDEQLRSWLLFPDAKTAKRLRLRNAELTDSGAKHLADSAPLLEELDLGDNLIRDQGALALSTLPKLRSLNLYGNQITDIGASGLVNRLALEELNLCGNQLAGAGLSAITAQSERFTKLHLGFLQMQDHGAAIVAQASWPKLKELNLRLNQLSARAIPAFLYSGRFPALKYLGIEENPLGDEIVRELHEHRPAKQGERYDITINLGGIEISEPAARELLPFYDSGMRLLLHDNLFDERELLQTPEDLTPWDWVDGLYRTTLIAYHERGVPRRYQFDLGRISIGRTPDNDLVHPMGNISKHHTALLITRAGKVFAVDQKSTNGTRLNGENIFRPTEMKLGDTLYPGGLVVHLECEPESLMERTREGCAAYHPRRPTNDHAGE